MGQRQAGDIRPGPVQGQSDGFVSLPRVVNSLMPSSPTLIVHLTSSPWVGSVINLK